jgi:hypothetical protein
MRTAPRAVVDDQHRQYSENRNRERYPDRVRAFSLRMIRDHRNTSPDVSLKG